MAKVYCSISILIALIYITGCGPGSPPSMNSVSYQVHISVDPVEGGRVLPDLEEVNEGEFVEITATPNEGWLFDSWQGDHSGNNNPDTIMVDSDKEIMALFLKRDYPLTINVEGEGSISERIIQDKTTEYPHGTTVELTAEPTDGWKFIEWVGEDNNEENPIQIVVDEEKEVTALFEKDYFSLTVDVEGSGSVEMNIQSGNESDGLFEYESVIELQASADVGWGFSGWEGDLNEDQNPMAITIDSDKTVKAVFVQSNSDFDGGSGTELDPYRVSTLDHLQNIIEDNYRDKHFIQIDNINAVSSSNWNRGKGFKPIGSKSSPFTGTYDGNGYEIRRITINREDEDYVGLFGAVDQGIIKNTRLVNSSISGDEVVGGLVGYNDGQIFDSYIQGTIKGEEEVGGFAGRNGGEIQNSYASVEVTGDEEVGGFVGYNAHKISGSFSDGSVKGDDDKVGGLVGVNRGDISNSYSGSNVEGEEETGGLVGENHSNGSVSLSYSSGRVKGDKHVGGIIGSNKGDLTTSYWDVDAAEQKDATGRGSSSGTTGLKTSEMTGSSAEGNMNEFDWSNTWVTTTGYPILKWQDR